MPRTREHILPNLHLGSLALLVIFDGGVPFLASASVLLLFGALLFLSSSIRFRRPLLHRLRLTAIILVLLLSATAILQVWWDPTGRSANAIWRHLTEELGEAGGARAVMRFQPLWELPGITLPFVAFATAVPLFRSGTTARQLWIFVAVLGAAFATYGILQATLFPTWHFGERKAYADSLTGFYVNRNVAAAFLILTSLATITIIDRALEHIDLDHLARLASGRGRPRPEDRRLVYFFGLFVVQFIALFLTKSRAGSAIELVTIAVYISLHLPTHLDRWGRRLTKRFILVAGVIVVAIVSVLAARVGQRYDLQGLDDSRWCAYPAMIAMTLDNLPWGVGFGGFVTAYAGYRLPDCGLFGVWDSAHDGYIQGMATMGLLFPVVLGVVILSLLPPLLANRRRDQRSKSMVDAVLLGAAALAVHSLVDFPLEIPANAALLATLAASAIGMSSEGRRRIGEPKRRPSLRRGRVSHRTASGTAEL